nr:hypothetical protein [Tanacetum cinerariifolium]
MKEVFDQMEAQVDQHAVDKKCDETERKNLLVENENLISECLSTDVFYNATDYVLIVSNFSDMHDAYTVAQKRIAELEAENSNLTYKIQNDDHDEMIKHFSKLEVEHLNFQLKYKHLKERFGNKKLVTYSDAPAFESVFVIRNLKEQLQGRGNTIRELKEKISCLQKKHSEADPIFDFKALDSQNKDLNAKVSALQDLNEHFKAENKKIKGKTECVTMPDHVKLKVLAPGVKDAIAASGSKPRINTKKDRTLSAKSDKKKVEDHSRNNKSSVKQKNRVDSSISYNRDRSRLKNFVKKFIGTVRFGNNHFGAIIDYGDYVIDLEVAFCKHSCYVRDVNGVDLIKDLVRGLPRLKFKKDHLCSVCQLGKSQKYSYKPKSENTNLEVLNTLHMDLCGPMRVQTINEKKYILVIVDDYSSEDLRKFRPTADIEIFVGYAPNRKGYRVYNERTRQIMEIIHMQFNELTEPMDHVHITPYVPPTNKDLEILFQLMFDEYFKPSGIERLVPLVFAVQVLVVSAGERKTRKRQNRNKTGQKQKAWKSPAISKANHSREIRKENKYRLKGPILANPRRCIKVKLNTRADIAIYSKLHYKGCFCQLVKAVKERDG